MSRGTRERSYFELHVDEYLQPETEDKRVLDYTGFSVEVQDVIKRFVDDNNWISASQEFIDYLSGISVPIESLKPNEALHYLTQMSKRKRH